jgi:hypothetical protein
MEKIDRLGWAAGICFVAYGRRIGIRANTADVLDRLEALFPPGWRPAASPVVEHIYSLIAGGNGSPPTIRRFNLLYAGPARLARTLDLDEVLRLLESDLQLYVAEMARRRLFMHAGVVGWRGGAIVIPGRSFTGKTTLVTALLRAGASYYSDELAVFDPHGRVHPFPKALSLRDEDGRLLGRVSPEDMGSSPGVKPLPVRVVLLTTHKPGARWQPRSISVGRAVLELLAHTPAARRRPKFALATLSRAVSRARVLKGARGEAAETAKRLLRISF